MNCFVIMPFATDFDDVYDAIKVAVEEQVGATKWRCIRLDDRQPAGRLTERLVQELRTASLCIADLTGNRPNVLWETGFAMALGCPCILITQNRSDIPLDIRDMQTLQYLRSSIGKTLRKPLEKSVADTLSTASSYRPSNDSALAGELLTQVADLSGQLIGLKSIVAEAVRAWSPVGARKSTAALTTSLSALEGHWKNEESGSHLYARVVAGDLIAPYSYGGNRELTGVYFGWRSAGDYWFARYAWIDRPHSGFTFLRPDSKDTLRGAWWGDELGHGDPEAPPPDMGGGRSAKWRRIKVSATPRWADRFWREVQTKGLPAQVVGPALAKNTASPGRKPKGPRTR